LASAMAMQATPPDADWSVPEDWRYGNSMYRSSRLYGTNPSRW